MQFSKKKILGNFGSLILLYYYVFTSKEMYCRPDAAYNYQGEKGVTDF